MNNIATEAVLVGMLYRYPALQHLITTQDFASKEYKSIAEEAKTWYESNPSIAPPLTMLYSMQTEKGTEKYSHFTVQSLIDFCERNTPKTEEEAKANISFLNAKIEQTKYERSVIEQIDDAKTYILDGKPNLAVALLRTLPFRYNAHEFPTTKELMLSALTESSGFRTGIKSIDDYTGGWYMGNILSICGDTGSQKTRASLWMVIQILEANPTFKAVYFEKEMPVKDIARMMLAKYVGIKHDHIIKASKEEKDTMKKTVEEVIENPIIKDILERITFVSAIDFSTVTDIWKVLQKTEANVWVLDYMSLLDGEAKGSGEKAFVVMDNIKRIKEVTHQTNSFAILLNQLNKGTVERRMNKIPVLDDIEWSSDIKKLSAYVLATFFPKNYYSNVAQNYFYLVSLKNRDKANYVVPLLSDPSSIKFEEPEHDNKLKMGQYITDYINAFNS